MVGVLNALGHVTLGRHRVFEEGRSKDAGEGVGDHGRGLDFKEDEQVITVSNRIHVVGLLGDGGYGQWRSVCSGEYLQDQRANRCADLADVMTRRLMLSLCHARLKTAIEAAARTLLKRRVEAHP